MFEVQSNTYYDDGINIGRAVVFMNRNYHAAKVDFIYMADENDAWSFHYENDTYLTEEEEAALENWFINWFAKWRKAEHEKSYPVSKEVCSKCGACSLVTKDASGAYLNVSEQYYQCLSGAERECRESNDNIKGWKQILQNLR